MNQARLFDDEAPSGFPSGAQRVYDKAHSWQYDIRLRNRAQDLADIGMTEEEAERITLSDFQFAPLRTAQSRRLAVAFIKRHEWLGTLSQYTTHWFGAWYVHHGKFILAGVILMNMPNAFSKLLGDDTPQLERLISRGACISWSPKNLASAFMMWSIRWMVSNTQYRLFTAYADPTAKELGTIYQACNFYYLGQDAGTTARYVNPYTGKLVSDRFFRSRNAYRKYARELGIEWKREWTQEITVSERTDLFGSAEERTYTDRESIVWANIPPEIAQRLREHSRMKQESAVRVASPSKHKYAMVLGKSARETKYLRRRFEERNTVKPYPKPEMRGIG